MTDEGQRPLHLIGNDAYQRALAPSLPVKCLCNRGHHDVELLMSVDRWLPSTTIFSFYLSLNITSKNSQSQECRVRKSGFKTKTVGKNLLARLDIVARVHLEIRAGMGRSRKRRCLKANAGQPKPSSQQPNTGLEGVGGKDAMQAASAPKAGPSGCAKALPPVMKAPETNRLGNAARCGEHVEHSGCNRAPNDSTRWEGAQLGTYVARCTLRRL